MLRSSKHGKTTGTLCLCIMATGPRERFLAQASVSLRDAAPSVAQQLRINGQYISTFHGIDKQSTQGQSCQICGSVKIETRTVKIPEKFYSPKHASRLTALRLSELVISKCQTCLRSRKVPMRETKTELSQDNTQSSETSANAPSNLKGSSSKVQKTSSKKRAKERKNREGLQTLLAKASANTRPSNTFDLMDFMSSRN